MEGATRRLVPSRLMSACCRDSPKLARAVTGAVNVTVPVVTAGPSPPATVAAVKVTCWRHRAGVGRTGSGVVSPGSAVRVTVVLVWLYAEGRSHRERSARRRRSRIAR